MHIVICGATGLIGSLLLERLIDHTKISQITTITRSPLNLDVPKLNQIVFNSMEATHVSSVSIQADVFICALGTTMKAAGSKENFRKVDYDLVVAFANLAYQSNAQAFFVVSALGANQSSPIFYNRVKGEMEQAIMAINFPSCYVLRPSLLIGERKEQRYAEAAGIAFYRIAQHVLPKGLAKKIGTPVEAIVSYIVCQLSQLKPGNHIVTDYF